MQIYSGKFADILDLRQNQRNNLKKGNFFLKNLSCCYSPTSCFVWKFFGLLNVSATQYISRKVVQKEFQACMTLKIIRISTHVPSPSSLVTCPFFYDNSDIWVIGTWWTVSQVPSSGAWIFRCVSDPSKYFLHILHTLLQCFAHSKRFQISRELEPTF